MDIDISVPIEAKQLSCKLFIAPKKINKKQVIQNKINLIFMTM